MTSSIDISLLSTTIRKDAETILITRNTSADSLNRDIASRNSSALDLADAIGSAIMSKSNVNLHDFDDLIFAYINSVLVENKSNALFLEVESHTILDIKQCTKTLLTNIKSSGNFALQDQIEFNEL